MITAALPMAATGVLAAGVQSHGRSLLVWPELLDLAGEQLLRGVVPFGARVIAFGPVPPVGDLPVWPGKPLTSRYDIYRWRPSAGGAVPDFADSTCGCDRCHAGVQALQRAGGLTPLPALVLERGSGWRHAVVAERHTPVAVASAQLLAWPLPDVSTGAVRLVAGVAVAPGRRRAGLGGAVVERVVAGPDAAVALVAAADRPARRFFEALGWDQRGAVATYARWE